MKYDELIQKFAQRPFFETGELLTLFDEPELQVMARLSRWVSDGKLIRLRRGKYLLPTLYQKEPAHPFYISNYLYTPSYISFYSALQYYQMIPEHVPRIQALTTKQTASWDTILGAFSYSSAKQSRFFGYTLHTLGTGSQQRAYIATPEKALLDICLSQAGEWTEKRWLGLRLNNMELIHAEVLDEYVCRLNRTKAYRAIQALTSATGISL
ncbi:MAG: hypothetical protein GXO90_05745 [FCB group bacterium]|nr:hypothetical protein [FCB group bacterium]